MFGRTDILRQNADGLQIEFSIVPATDDEKSSVIRSIDAKLSSLHTQTAELDEEIKRLTSHADGLDYAIAVSAGILSGLFDSLFVGEIAWETEKGQIHKKFNQFIEAKAKAEGYNGTNGLKGAIAFLEEKYPLASDNIWSGKKVVSWTQGHHLDDFAHHPTPIGFLANFVTTLFRVGIFSNKSGEWHFVSAPIAPKELFSLWSPLLLTALLHWLVAVAEQKYTEAQQKEIPKPLRVLLRSIASAPAIYEIIKITDNWLGHLASDMGGSKNTPAGGMGIPGVFLSLFKELASVPPFNMTGLPQLINKWYTKNKFDMRTEATIMSIAGKQAVPVLLNEIFVRGFYFVRRLIEETKIHGRNWQNYDWQKTLPFNNRTIVRMLEIAHGTFVAFDITDAAIRTAISGQYVDPATFLSKMVLRINFIGIGRLTVALITDLGMGIKRSIKTHKQIQLYSQMLCLYDAKVFYKQNDMWIEAKNSEIATREMYETSQKAIIYFIQIISNMQRKISNIDFGQVEHNNPGLPRQLFDLLDN